MEVIGGQPVTFTSISAPPPNPRRLRDFPLDFKVSPFKARQWICLASSVPASLKRSPLCPPRKPYLLHLHYLLYSYRRPQKTRSITPCVLSQSPAPCVCNPSSSIRTFVHNHSGHFSKYSCLFFCFGTGHRCRPSGERPLVTL